MSKRSLGVLGATVLVAGMMACSDGNQATGPTLSDGSTTVTSGGSGGQTQAGRLRIEIRLTGSAAFPRAKGKAKFQSQARERELQVEVENLRPGMQVDFFLAGMQVGTRQTADALGHARINLNTSLGASVPVSVAGSPVEVRTAAGAGVATGTF